MAAITRDLVRSMNEKAAQNPGHDDIFSSSHHAFQFLFIPRCCPGAARRRSEGQTVTRALKGRKSKVRKLKKKVPIIRVKSLFLFGPENK